MERFQDRRIIVTGGGSGIGRATVLRLLQEAGTVHTVDVDEPGLVGTAELADAEGIGKRLTTALLDVSDEQAVDTGMRATVERFGGLDVLVNAAGILRAAHTHECTLDMWNQVINVNLTGTFLMCRAAIPALLESDHASIVNFSSTSAAFGHPYMAAYAASKGGIDAMTHTLAIEYGKRGIRVHRGRAGQHPERDHRDDRRHDPRRRRLGPVRQDVARRRPGVRPARRRGVGHRHARVRRRPLRHRHRAPHRRWRPRLTHRPQSTKLRRNYVYLHG